MAASKFKIALRPGTQLSSYFNNSRNCYKIVETSNVLGYIVSGGGRESAPALYPLYRADVHIKTGKSWHFVSTYEQGERLNDYTFLTDPVGCAFASIASQAIRALEERKRALKLETAKRGTPPKVQRGAVPRNDHAPRPRSSSAAR